MTTYLPLLKKKAKRVALAALLCGGLALGWGTAAQAQTPPTIRVEQGALRCADSGDGMKCLGVPYAAPPVGSLRFKAPTPPATWEGERDASRFASVCLQAKSEYSHGQEGSEDCLYLNVYVPTRPDNTDAAHLPVMVWLHGGGFVNGSGNAFDGERLAKTANAIVVTVNYRLGPFGWLALPTLASEAGDHSTGNYGLLDSVAALRWVKRNISAFGGDPARVTLFGQSAGGEQTLALVASPYGAGLFQRAISMSAPASLPMPTVDTAAAKRGAFLAELGCTDPANQPACLRALPADRVLAAAHISWDLIKMLGLQWTPTVDGAVLPDQWLNRFREGKINRVAVMIGHTRHESNLFVAIHENNQGAPIDTTQVEERSKAYYSVMAPLVLRQYEPSSVRTPAERMAQTSTDASFVLGQAWDRQALIKHVPVFAYESCDPDAAPSHVQPRFSKLGCAHDSDLQYLFQWDDFTGEVPHLTAEQLALARAMGMYWGNFAAKGDPNGPGLPAWPAQTEDAASVQLLEPASLGGIRTQSGSEYAQQHNLVFWERLAAFKRNMPFVILGVVLIVLLLGGGLLLRRKRKAVRLAPVGAP